MARQIRRIRVWNNEAGIVLSNAGNVFLEAGGSARTYCVPAGNWTGLGGNRFTGEADTNTPNNTVDTIRGGPALRREHLFLIEPLKLALDDEGFDKMFIERRLYVLSDATGFALNAAAPSNLARTYWGSSGFLWGAGSFIQDDTPLYLKEPPVICYNTNESGKNSSPLAGATGNTAVEPIIVAGGHQLTARSFGDPDYPLGSFDPRQLHAQITREVLPHSLGAGNSLTKAGMIRGYSAKASGVDISRYPKAGDVYSSCYELGYQDGGGSYHQGGITAAGYTNVPRLSITGLAKIWFAIYDNAPPTGATSPYLNFTNASMTVGGSIYVTLIRE